ncbi:MAG: putative glycolipid-binding domain-containing protein, partial [Acidimicrobiia bacterium]|nr:putative glycolipid-binding domain-containing protein [Acidimicrobiia bacterium]
NWEAGGEPVPALQGATDVDLDCTPATNTIPIRRLGLDIGHTAAVRVAYLSFLGTPAAALDQSYEHVADGRYRYESGDFTTELTVATNGFVVDYPGYWSSGG